MLTIIDQYKEKVNLAASHGQRLEDEHAKVSYPNFIRGPFFGGMQPSFDRLEVLNTHR